MRYSRTVQLGLPFVAASAAPPLVAPAAGPVPCYFVRHRRARRYLLRVDPDGRVRVTIPARGSRREADAFLRRNLDWVQRQRARLSPAAPVDAAQRQAWLARARHELPARLFELARELDLAPAGVSIRNQRSRWGSCAPDGRISLNWRLVRMPDWVRDYVIVHELMHLRRMDHSPAYWRLVAAACPTYVEARAWLRAHGRTL